VTVCDAFHAMTSDRPYRPAAAVEAALDELQRCAGHQFDPVVVQAFARVVTGVRAAAEATGNELGPAWPAPVSAPADSSP
jgi:HD-GYP domain-containing protein (c-di-GMP phosphodiesterase class II)